MAEKNFFDTELSSEEKLRQLFEATLKGVREEFDDHLESINDNTNEIQANYEYISKIDERMERMEKRLSQLESWMARLTGVPIAEEEEKRIFLTEKEKKVFLILYTASEEDRITYEKISEDLGENEFLIRGYVTNMLEKGVPVQKRYFERKVYLSLDKDFKEKQAKSNLLGISQTTVREFLA